MSLILKDYRAILNFYGINNKSLNNENIKKKAEKILAEKLCKCIKKVNKNDEKKSIAICRSSVLHRKGIDMYKFSCKKKSMFKIGKNKQRLRKLTKKLSIRKSKQGSKRTIIRLNNPSQKE
jgi:hypothetical protein